MPIMGIVSDSERQRAPWPSRLVADVFVQVVLGLIVVGLAVAVGVSWGRRSRPERRPAAPQPPTLPQAHPIWDSWRAAWDGGVESYLACFAGPAREALEAELAAKGREAFARGLRREAAAALAIDLEPERRVTGEGSVFRVTVQHERDAERFDYRVALDGSRWRIIERVSRGLTTATSPYAERLAPPAEQGEKR